MVLLSAVTVVLLFAVSSPYTCAAPGPVQAGTQRDYTVPPGLLIGAGVSAVQTEGAWNVDGKAESAADHVFHALKWTPSHDDAAKSYYKYKDDVRMAAELKLKVYKFSISWARVLPTGSASEPNQKGVEYYHNLIDEILKYGMTPLVEMYHFDHPQVLQDQFKGWESAEMITKFGEYAQFIFKEYASKVKLWITINEPNMYCSYFNALYLMAHMYTADELNVYRCLHNNMLAHLEASRAFKAGKYEGKMGLSVLMVPAFPKTNSVADIYAAEAVSQTNTGINLSPVVHGDYPALARQYLKDKLPQFTAQQTEELKASSDFVALNVYFGAEVSYNWAMNSSTGASPVGSVTALPFVDMNLIGSLQQGPFASINPEVLQSALQWAHLQYGLPIVIAENGFGDTSGMGKDDPLRAQYFSAYLRAMVETIEDTNVEVLAYCAWSLIDSYEFSAGFSRPFGLVHVDFSSPDLTRSHKKSSSFWMELGESGRVPIIEQSDDSTSSAAGSSTVAWGLLLALIYHFL